MTPSHVHNMTTKQSHNDLSTTFLLTHTFVQDNDKMHTCACVFSVTSMYNLVHTQLHHIVSLVRQCDTMTSCDLRVHYNLKMSQVLPAITDDSIVLVSYVLVAVT